MAVLFPFQLFAVVLMASLAFGSLHAQPERITDPATGLQYDAPVRSAGSWQAGSSIPLRHPAAGESRPLPTPLRPLSDNIQVTFPGPLYEDNAAQIGFAFIPPDPMGAVGYDRVISVVNVVMEMRDRSGALLWLEDLRTFFSPLGGQTLGTYTFDPKVIFDPYADRFVVVTLEQTDSPMASRILLAVSKTASPATPTAQDWWYLAIDSRLEINGTLTWADYPGFEVDEEAVYVTANMFPFGSGSTSVRLWIIDKGESGGFYDGGAASFAVHDPYANGGVPVTTMPAQVFGTGGIPGGSGDIGTYLAAYSGLSDGLNERVQITRVDDPLGNAGGPFFSLETIDVGNIDDVSRSISASPQPGSAGGLDDINSGFRSVFDCVWRDGALWLVTVVNAPAGPDAGQVTAHWVHLNTSAAPGGPVTLVDQGGIGGETLAPETHTYYPSVMVTAAGDAHFGFAASAPTLYAGAYSTGRAPGDPAGVTRPPLTLAPGLDFYKRTFGSFRNRWGDYTGIAFDPVADSLVWVFNQFAGLRGSPSGGEDGRWETVWAAVTLPDTPVDPWIVAGPGLIDFANAFAGDTLVQRFYVENVGGAPLEITSIVPPAAPFFLDSLSGGTATIPPLSRITVPVSFRPDQIGTFSDSLVILSNDPARPTTVIYLSGTASDPVTPARRDVLYGTTYDAANNYYLMTMDPLTGVYDLVGALSESGGAVAINSRGEAFVSTYSGNLYRIDPTTGTGSLIANTGSSFNAMEFGANDTLYVLQSISMPPFTSNLYRYDLATGSLDLIGSPPVDLVELAVDPTTGTLWACGGPAGGQVWDYIYTVDTQTAATTLRGQVGLSVPPGFITRLSALSFNGRGELFGIHPRFTVEQVLFQLDPVTITPTIIAQIPTGALPIVNTLAGFLASLPGPNLTLSVSEIDFGQQEPGWGSDTALVRIASVGTDPVTVIDMTLPFGPYSLILDSLTTGGTLPVTIAPGETERFQVAFAATDTGRFLRTLSVASDDGDDPAVAVPLSGEGRFTPLGSAFAAVGTDAGTSSGQLLAINTATGAGTIVGSTGLTGISALAVSSGGILVAAEAGTGRLFRLSHLDGARRLLAETALSGFRALAFDGADSLYAIGDDGPDYSLYRIDIHSGAATPIGATGDAFTALAFDPLDGTLWAATGDGATTPDAVFHIDPATGSATLVGAAGLTSVGILEGLMFDPAGNLYGVKTPAGPPARFVSIDKATGAATSVGPVGARRVSALAARLQRAVLVGIDDAATAAIPESFALLQNYPNPFNPSTTIRYGLPVAAPVSVAIYDVLGRRVRTLLDGNQAAGWHRITWNGRDDQGERVSSGIYIYRLQAGEFMSSRKLVLMR